MLRDLSRFFGTGPLETGSYVGTSVFVQLAELALSGGHGSQGVGFHILNLDLIEQGSAKTGSYLERLIITFFNTGLSFRHSSANLKIFDLDIFILSSHFFASSDVIFSVNAMFDISLQPPCKILVSYSLVQPS